MTKNLYSIVMVLVLSLVQAAGVLAPSRAVAQTDGTYQVTIKKQEEKKKSRWSLADWLVQKRENQKMDMWLAANSQSSHYEFFLEGNSLNFNQTNGDAGATPQNRNVSGGALAAYAGVAGLRGSYDQINEETTSWSGSLNLRLLGRAVQDTHLNLEYGLRGTSLVDTAVKDTYQNQFGGVSLNLYLAKSFGIEGVYHRILPAESQRHREMEGEDSKAGVFIDFSFVRVFGHWRHEFLHFKGGGIGDASQFRQGYGGGLRLYF
ncbi:MAG: hypothetical protein V4692_14600 [Bdellovibrionota bacterium]